MIASDTFDARFDVPLYTRAEAARYVGMPSSTLRTWTHGDKRRVGGRIVTRRAVVTATASARPGSPAIPFIGLAEAMFLAALRKAGVPMQQIRPALHIVQERIGVEHALASRRLYAVGAQILWEVSEVGELDSDSRRVLIVLKDGQYIFREVVEHYLQRIEYADDDYARRVFLPGYEVARVEADPTVNFGRASFSFTGTPVEAVLGRIRAGEPPADVAEDFSLPLDHVIEAADREACWPYDSGVIRASGLPRSERRDPEARFLATTARDRCRDDARSLRRGRGDGR